MSEFVYLATVYTGGTKDQSVWANREYEVSRFVAEHELRTYEDRNPPEIAKVIYSPITHAKPIADRFDLPHTFDFWSRIDYTMIECASEFWVLFQDGWEHSEGLRKEILHALAIGKPFRFFSVAPNGDFLMAPAERAPHPKELIKLMSEAQGVLSI